jgi:hypothetical protein
MQDADETFRLGIARGAAPLERLQAKHTAFQKRMMASTLAPASASSTTPAAVPSAPPKRRILGDSSKKPSTSTSAPLSAQPAPAPRANAQIAVFVDDEPDNTLATNAWPELGTRTARVKENVRAPGPMAGATLKQRRAPAPARSGGFAVFTGPEDEPAPASARKAADPARKAADPARKGAKAAEMLVPFTDYAPVAAAAEAFVPFVDDDGGNGGFVPFCDEGEDEVRGSPAYAATCSLVSRTGAGRGSHVRAGVGHAAQGGGRGPRARERGGGAAEEPAEELPWAGVVGWGRGWYLRVWFD